MVVRVAEELDRQRRVVPATVDPASTGGTVGLRQREVDFLESAEEAFFELAEEDVDVAPQDPSQLPGTRGVWATGEDRFDLLGPHSVKHLRLVHRACQVVLRKDCGEVNERAGNSRDRNASEEGRLAAIHLPAPPQLQTVHAAAGRSRDLGRRRRALDQPEEIGGGPPAQHSAVPRRFHRCHVARLQARCLVPHAVDAPVNTNQQTHTDPARDLFPRDRCAKQFGATNDPVLSARDSRDFSLYRPGFYPHQGPNPGRFSNSPPSSLPRGKSAARTARGSGGLQRRNADPGSTAERA